MSADAANPTSIYIYNVDKPSWSVQATTPGGFDFVNSKAILDHDTNVFCVFFCLITGFSADKPADALSKEEAYFLDMGSLTTAKKTAIPWTNAQRSPFPANYEPIMALAQNHIHFLGVPGIAAGSAEIFVIHCECITSLCVDECADGMVRLILPAQASGLPVAQRFRDSCHSRAGRIFLPKVRGM